MTALITRRARPRRLRMLLVALLGAFACVAFLASSATAGSTTSVIFTADSYVSANPGATWTVGFTTSSSGALVTGNTVDVTFPSGFNVSGATAAFSTGFSSCTTPTTQISGQVVIVPLTGAGCSLGNSTGASVTISHISAAATQYAAAGFNVTTYANGLPSPFSTPIDGVGGHTPSPIDITASVAYSTLASNGASTTGGVAPTDPSSPYSTALAPTVTVLGNPGGLALSGYAFSGWCTTRAARRPPRSRPRRRRARRRSRASIRVTRR